MKKLQFKQLPAEKNRQINSSRLRKRFEYILKLLLTLFLLVQTTVATAQHCGGAATTLAKWDFNTENIQCNVT